jgi:hypothetical protein
LRQTIFTNPVKKGTKMTKKELKNFATSMTALLFLVIGGSGLMMFFHLFDSRVKELHEILGLAFVAVILLHVFYNWGSMKSYFTRKIFLVSALVVFVTASAFVAGAGGGESPKGMIIKSVLSAPVEEVSRLFSVDPADARQRLADRGITIFRNQSVDEIAKANQVSPFEVITIISRQKD